MHRALSPCLPKAVIFDMDGLIFDTEALYQRALLGLARERGIVSITQATADQTVGLSWASTRKLLAHELPSHIGVDEFIEAWTDQYDEIARFDLTLKPGVIELLDALDARGIARAVATGSYRDVAMRHLAEFELHSRFDAIVAKEDCVNGKPAPEPFLASASRLKVAPASCWALEDSRNGIRSAHDAGMETIMIPDLLAPDATTVALCSHIGASLNEVVRLIEERA
jgi:HAD superfamily hydrolase (TIGR01509 family)